MSFLVADTSASAGPRRRASTWISRRSNSVRTRSGFALGRSILLIATIIGTFAALAWWMASTVGDVTPSSAATTEMTMSVTLLRVRASRCVAGGVDEGDLAAGWRCHLVGADMLGDAASFARRHLGRANRAREIRESPRAERGVHPPALRVSIGRPRNGRASASPVRRTRCSPEAVKCSGRRSGRPRRLVAPGRTPGRDHELPLDGHDAERARGQPRRRCRRRRAMRTGSAPRQRRHQRPGLPRARSASCPSSGSSRSRPVARPGATRMSRPP